MRYSPVAMSLFERRSGTGLQLLAIALAACACSKRPTSDSPPASATPVPAPPPAATLDPTPAPARSAAMDAKDAGIESWILVRLRRPGRALSESEPPLADTLRESLSIRAARGYAVESPAMRLVVARFDDQARANAAEKALIDALAAGEPPLHHARSSITGAYLLVVGFPSHKPVSPEMESARTGYLSAFAGEE